VAPWETKQAMAKSKTVSSFIAAAPARTRGRLRQLRSAIKSAAPGITERISYRIPTFDLDGNYLLYIAAFENHVSVYPVTKGMIAAHGSAIAKYRSGKGTLRFGLDEPLPRLGASPAKARRSTEPWSSSSSFIGQSDERK
jgi:uncharacterized protein YdhG (YjbR/CyaY superfamily)